MQSAPQGVPPGGPVVIALPPPLKILNLIILLAIRQLVVTLPSQPLIIIIKASTEEVVTDN